MSQRRISLLENKVHGTLNSLNAKQHQSYPLSLTWLLVESWLICIQHRICSPSFWCMLGGSVED